MCSDCKKKHSEWHRGYIAELRKKGLCTWGGCKKKAVTKTYCEEHRVAFNALRREWRRRKKELAR